MSDGQSRAVLIVPWDAPSLAAIRTTPLGALRMRSAISRVITSILTMNWSQFDGVAAIGAPSGSPFPLSLVSRSTNLWSAYLARCGE